MEHHASQILLVRLFGPAAQVVVEQAFQEWVWELIQERDWKIIWECMEIILEGMGVLDVARDLGQEALVFHVVALQGIWEFKEAWECHP